MRDRRAILALVCFWLLVALIAYCDDKSATEKAAADAATAWLVVVDSGQYGESWFQAASTFRNAVSKEQWRNTRRSSRSLGQGSITPS
jgi:hypothetical protein